MAQIGREKSLNRIKQLLRANSFRHVCCIWLILMTPVASFLTFNAVSVVSLEGLIFGFGCATLSLLFGIIVTRARSRWIPAVVYSFLFLLYIDFQTSWFDHSQGLGVLLCFMLGVLVVLALREKFLSLTLWVFMAMFVGSALGPKGSAVTVWNGETPATNSSDVLGQAPSNRIVHLILDEHIGLDGIPQDDAKGKEVKRQLEEFYLDHGFQLFSQAFSRHYLTSSSLSNMFNFSKEASWAPFYDTKRFYDASLAANSYFVRQKQKGYRVSVIQTDYMDFCRTTFGFQVARCVTVASERLEHLKTFDLSYWQRARIAMGIMGRLSYVREKGMGLYDRLSKRRLFSSWLPQITSPVRLVSSASALESVRQLNHLLQNSKAGDHIVAHLLLPHYPYLFQPDCSVTSNIYNWINSSDLGAAPKRNTESSRIRGYDAYLDQMKCLYVILDKIVRKIEDSDIPTTVIIHGDHGSKLGRLHPHDFRFKSEIRPEDFVDGFSTLFAVKDPSIQAGLDRRQLALDDLFGAVIQGGAVPPGVSWADKPFVFLLGKKILRHKMVPTRNSLK